MSVSFPLGRVLATPGAVSTLAESCQDPSDFITRHARGDWGEVSAEDKRANTRALADGTRLLSAYTTAVGDKLWIITEADRSATTLLLPSEY